MLGALFANLNIERILLFLLVNERCYGAQIQSLLEVPLTPVQNALARLEKEGVIRGAFEGKTKIYRLSSEYPLHRELEALLKRAYSLLPTAERKRYCYVHKPRLQLKEQWQRDRNQRGELIAFWDVLGKMKRLEISARSGQGSREGKAALKIESPDSNVLIFQERGFWLQDQLPDTAFSNTFRWTLDLKASLVTLEHLRYGSTQPVLLFQFAPARPFLLDAVDAHLCSDDTYFGSIVWKGKGVDFHWRTLGPKKNDTVRYRYT